MSATTCRQAVGPLNQLPSVAFPQYIKQIIIIVNPCKNLFRVHALQICRRSCRCSKVLKIELKQYKDWEYDVALSAGFLKDFLRM